MSEDKVKILLADDHAVVREGLKSLIDAQPDLKVVGEAGDGEAARRLVAELLPDVVVMDVSMPGMTGDRATAILTGEHPGVKILALTVHEDREHLRRLLQAGASGYVLKMSSAAEFLRALRVVASGGVYLDPAVAGKVVGELVQGVTAPADEATLTDRETEVVLRVAQGFSNKEIAAQLEISVKTVETHKLRSMDKLGLKGRADVVQFALRRGWLTPTG
jgi:DNA-binding NarL/FixJ family response regulator